MLVAVATDLSATLLKIDNLWKLLDIEVNALKTGKLASLAAAAVV